MKAITIMAALVATAIVLSGCGPRSEKAQEAQEAEMPQATKEAPAQAKELTDDDFIEYWAQIAYLTEKQQANPLKLNEELSKLHEKYPGIDEKYTAWLTEWQQKMMEDVKKGSDKTSKQWEEMMKRMENRVAELKKGN